MGQSGMIMDVRLIKMWSGEDVVAEVVSEDLTHITISNPIMMVPQGQNVGFAPWSPFLSKDVKELKVRVDYVVYVSDPSEEVLGHYSEIFSPIVTPKNKGLIL